MGASLAVALCTENLKIAIIEAVTPQAASQPSFDDRGLALSISSVRILQGLDIWKQIMTDAAAIKEVHVSDRNHFGFVRLSGRSFDMPVLGYVALAKTLGRVLLDRLEHSDRVEYICPAKVEAVSIHKSHVKVLTKADGAENELVARLLIAADGTSSTVREMLGITVTVKDYNQTAIVTNVIPEKPHRGIAYERFTESGPVALLPLPDQRCAAVITVGSKDARHYFRMDENGFLQALQNRFGKRLGKFQQMGKRSSYSIKQVMATRQVMERAVLLGNSAHTIHPNSAQGFNLCLRDVAGLVEILVPAVRNGQDIGALELLNKYRQYRQPDQATISNFTDGLAWLFYNSLTHRMLFRNIGMHVIDKVPMIKHKFIERISGLSGIQPLLVRE